MQPITIGTKASASVQVTVETVEPEFSYHPVDKTVTVEKGVQSTLDV